jgi:hypothetical protein
MKYHENSLSVRCGETDWQMGMARLVVAVQKFPGINYHLNALCRLFSEHAFLNWFKNFLFSANEQAVYTLMRYKSSLESHNCWFPIRLQSCLRLYFTEHNNRSSREISVQEIRPVAQHKVILTSVQRNVMRWISPLMRSIIT